jgi:hypothetical protein
MTEQEHGGGGAQVFMTDKQIIATIMIDRKLETPAINWLS